MTAPNVEAIAPSRKEPAPCSPSGPRRRAARRRRRRRRGRRGRRGGAGREEGGAALGRRGRGHRAAREWLAECDALVADVSLPSLGTGFKIAQAEALGKPTLLLHFKPPRQGHGGRVPRGIGGTIGAPVSRVIVGAVAAADPKRLALKSYATADEARAAIDAWFAGPAFGGPEPSAEPAAQNGD